ncbi:type I toxin-antitoxin system Ibs family toxin, partial [Escherichia coli]
MMKFVIILVVLLLLSF